MTSAKFLESFGLFYQLIQFLSLSLSQLIDCPDRFFAEKIFNRQQTENYSQKTTGIFSQKN
jgi:hypothetical protein